MSEESLLLKEIQQGRPFQSRQQEAFLNLLRTAAVLGQEMDRWFKNAGLTRTQYNALRILRGAHPGSLACSEVGERMVTPVPDVTRLLDRLEAVGLVGRSRDLRDRRVVNVAISELGLARLAALDEPLEEKLRGLLAPLEGADLASLVTLLERARGGKG